MMIETPTERSERRKKVVEGLDMSIEAVRARVDFFVKTGECVSLEQVDRDKDSLNAATLSELEVKL
jgi:hypothetical protein